MSAVDRVVRRVGADADPRGLGQEYPLDRHAQEVAFEFALQPVARPGARLAADIDAERLAEVGAQRRRHDVERRFVQRRAGSAYTAPSSVWLYSSMPRFSRIAIVDLPPEGGPSSSSRRRPTSEPAAAP